jgi:hypothetical protein
VLQALAYASDTTHTAIYEDTCCYVCVFILSYACAHGGLRPQAAPHPHASLSEAVQECVRMALGCRSVNYFITAYCFLLREYTYNAA